MDNIPQISYSSSSYIPPKDSEISFNKKDFKQDEEKLKADVTTPEKSGQTDKKSDKNNKSTISLSKNEKLDNREKQKVDELKRIDLHVRAHEHAHIAAGGPYVRGGPFYSYVIGPDGKMYAVAGEVKIDVSPVEGDPDATIRKAEVIKRAALAPSDPSPQDLAVAAQADKMAMEARIEKLKEQAEKMRKIFEKKIGEGDKDYLPYNKFIRPDDNFNPAPWGPSTLKKYISFYAISQTNMPKSTLHFVV